MTDFDIMTPIGKGTAIGLSPDRTRILVMHTRPLVERAKDKGPTYIHWWSWDDQKGEIVGDGQADRTAQEVESSSAAHE